MNIEEKIRSLLLEADQKSDAQLSYPGAANPQDPAPMPINYETLEFDRPGVVTDNVQQVSFPGQTAPEPMPVPPEFEEIDSDNPAADIVPAIAKESYPAGNGADDVVIPDADADKDPADKYSSGIQQAAAPAPMVAEAVGGYSVTVPKRVNAASEGKIMIVDQATAADVEKKLGLKKGTLTPTKTNYSKTVIIKGPDGKRHTAYSKDDGVRIRPYGHDDGDSTKQLHSHLSTKVIKEDANVAPTQAPAGGADDQQEILQQAIAAVQAGNSVEDVAKATGIDPKELQDQVDSATPAKSPPAPITTAPVSESLKQDVENLLSEETLSEDFKQKAGSLFESAVIARVNHESQRIEEAYDARMAKEIQSLQEQYVKAVDTFAESKSNQLSHYIDHLGEQWIKQNKVAVQQGIRTELAEGFITGMHKLFAENYVFVPDTKLDLVESQKAEMAALQESIKTMEASIKSLNEDNQSLKREAVIQRLSEGLVDTEINKLHSLCEGMEYENDSLFEEKVAMVKKNFFKKNSVKSPEQLLESEIHATQPQEQSTNTAGKPNTGVPAEVAASIQRLNRLKI